MAWTLRSLAAAAVAAAVWVGLGGAAAAGDVTTTVRDESGQPVEDAVVTALPEGRVVTPPSSPGREIVDQINLEFVPYVKPILVGTPVYFPNKDNVRHHVYSFSPAKRFELPLYVGTPAEPVVFDRAGIVTIGCNIHDWMIGHVYVAATPHLATTGADGRARLGDLPGGRYAVRAWHPRMEGPEDGTSRHVSLERAGSVDLTWQLKLRPALRPRRAPVPGQRGYR
jgi:plastocyanin